MTLEEIVYKRMTQSEGLTGLLTAYNGAPAVFLQRAPDDSMPGWPRDKRQYPRAEYLIDMTANPERHSNGYLRVYVYSSEDATSPEDIVPEIRRCLSDILVMADDMPYAITWDTMELFTAAQSENPSTLVNGAMITFLLIAFPSQLTGSPDPILGLQECMKAEWEDMMILGRDDFGDIYEPQDDAPAIYCRMDSYKTNREAYAVRWVDARIYVHVIAPTPEARAGWARTIADIFKLSGGLFLLDDSWMTIWSVEVNNRADPLTTGQVMLKAEYGIVPQRYAHPLNKINIWP